METTIKITEKLLFLLSENKRYKVLYGGRGSGKSWGIATALVISAIKDKKRVLCTRQLQTSIKDSVHKLICDLIEKLNLSSYFTITKDTIRCYNGSEFIFKGIQNNVMEIKSMEGIDICWVEEAQSVSNESWEILIPTIRKEGSEIWISFNPDRDEDPTYKRFVLNPPDDCKTVLVNYIDNPYFPDVLKNEMEYCKRVDYGKYEHIWLGKTVINTEVQVFKDKFELKDFCSDKNTQFFYGADWGFACLGGETLITTDKGDIPIKDIKAGDNVLTRDGYKKVLHTKNKGEKDVFDVDFGYKNSIIATEDHRIFTNNGWKQVKDLNGEEKVCIMKKNLMGRFINDTQMGNILTTFIGLMVGITKKATYYTEKFGSFITGKFLKIATFITLMVILLTIELKTLFVLQKVNIKKFIMKKNLVGYLKKSQVKMDIQKKIGKKEEKNLYKQLNQGGVFVKSVESLLSLQMFIKNSVARIVGSILIQGIVKKSIFVRYVVKSLWLRLIAKERLVQKNVPIFLHKRKEKETVYDITVENGEYFANGVLVHNCDPTTLTRSFIKGRDLYIEYEAGGVGVEMEEIPQLFDSVPESRKWVIRADCARPETISYVKRQGFRCQACEKWKGNIEDGIEYMRSFEHIYIHPRCKKTYEEFKFYSYKQDKISGDILPIVLDENNHYIDSIRYALEPYIKNRGKISIKDGWETAIDMI